eukprot:COSAG06_NODE_507_length_14929_cov_109.047067_7_plen_111_part_00
MMYHYRWDLDTDQYKASQFLMLSSNPAMPPEVLKERSEFIRARQTGRMDFVGAHTLAYMNTCATTLHINCLVFKCISAAASATAYVHTIVYSAARHTISTAWSCCGVITF